MTLQARAARLNRAAPVAVAIAAAFLSFASSALAVNTRPLVDSFGPDGTSGTSFAHPDALSFDQSSQHLYVLDQDSAEVDGLDVSNPGAYAPLGSPFPLAVSSGGAGWEDDLAADSISHDLYFVSESFTTLFGFDSSGDSLAGFPVTGFGDPCGAAVDPSGHVWVGDYAASQIKEFDSLGNQIGAVDTSGQGNPCHIAFNAAGDLYVALWNGATYEYTQASAYTSVSQIDPSPTVALAVDRSTGTFYVAHPDHVSAYESSGGHLYDFGTGVSGASYRGVAVNEAADEVYVADAAHRNVQVFGAHVTLPDVTATDPTSVTSTSATVTGTVNPDGVQLTDCHFDYGPTTAYGQSAPCVPAGGAIPADSNHHQLSADLTGLTANTRYHFRLAAANAEGATKTADATFTTTGPPLVETTGSPVRTATTARLDARVNPTGADTTYRFDYGTAGPCASNPCTSTGPLDAGSGDVLELVSQEVTGLQPATTYHYRIVADNGNPAGPSVGGDMALTTRASDAPPTHGHFPGPPHSDRAWEQVNVPDTGGNLVVDGLDFSDDGNRAIYNLRGGSPSSQNGSLSNQLYAERTPTGWQSRDIYPSRSQAPGNFWLHPLGRSDLSQLVATNFEGKGTADSWRISPDAPAQRVYGLPTAQWAQFTATSDDASRIVSLLWGSLDPSHPVTAAHPYDENLYDVSSGTPHLVSLLPGGTVPPCGVANRSERPVGPLGLPPAFDYTRAAHWISPDGSYVFFPLGADGTCNANPVGLYVRNLNAHTTDKLPCDRFIRATGDAAFLLCPDGNVRRYDLGKGSTDCVTCVVPGTDADVAAGDRPNENVAIPDDGSRVYFRSPNKLVFGASTPGIYRIDVATGDLAYVGPGGGTSVGDAGKEGEAINRNGSVIIFRSSNPGLNAVNGQQNATTAQYYRYDDRDRSLVCVSCSQDGSAPIASVPVNLRAIADQHAGPNQAPLSDAGDFAFVTDTPLISADQNTGGSGQSPSVGADVYEWRAGAVHLITDGITSSAGGQVPWVAGVSPSGRDVFFTQSAQLTPDAIDAYRRLYDARIGGGFDFPSPRADCSGDACGSPPSAPPPAPTVATATFSGPGNGTPAGPTATATVLSKVVRGTSFYVRVRVPGEGRVTIAGSRVRRVSRSVGSQGTYRLGVRLTGNAKRALGRKRKLKVRLRVRFAPVGGRAAEATFPVTVRRPAEKHARTHTTQAATTDTGGSR